MSATIKFTAHGMERLGERVKRCTAEEAYQDIQDAADCEALLHFADALTGEWLGEVFLRSGEWIYPLFSAAGEVVTILVEGMDFDTPTGRIKLERSGVGPGIHRLTAEQYHSDPCKVPALSSSIAKEIVMRSPRHGWVKSPRLNPEWEPTDSKAFDFGRAAHGLLLGVGGTYEEIPPEFLGSNGAASTKAAKEFIADCRARGATPLKSDEIEKLHRMHEVTRLLLLENNVVLDQRRSEVVAIAEIDGVMCRIMVDNAPLDPRLPLYDFKSTTDANPEECWRAIDRYGYDIQAAHFCEVWRAATGEERTFAFIFQEKDNPYEGCVVTLGPETMATGLRKIARAREIWGICNRTQVWPGYPRGVHAVELPNFSIGKWLDRESREADYKRTYGRDILEAAHRAQAPLITGES
jgi:hypothetical protein